MTFLTGRGLGLCTPRDFLYLVAIMDCQSVV